MLYSYKKNITQQTQFSRYGYNKFSYSVLAVGKRDDFWEGERSPKISAIGDLKLKSIQQTCWIPHKINVPWNPGEGRTGGMLETGVPAKRLGPCGLVQRLLTAVGHIVLEAVDQPGGHRDHAGPQQQLVGSAAPPHLAVVRTPARFSCSLTQT